MKSIVIIFPHLDVYAGIERNIVGLTKEIWAKGFLPVVLCYHDHFGFESFCPNTRIVKLGECNPVAKAFRVKNWLKANAESIHGLPFFFGGKAGFYAGLAWLRNYAFHYTDPPSLTGSAGLVRSYRNLFGLRQVISHYPTRLGVAHATKLLTMTHWNAKELEQLYGRVFEVIHQGGAPPIESSCPPRRGAGKTLRLFSICRLTKSKNLGWMIKAAEEIVREACMQLGFDSVEVTIAGKGPELGHLRSIARPIESEQLSFRFPGFLSNEELEEHYREADLFLVPGRQGYGLPVLEALYRHVPVVVNVESRISEILGENSWVEISQNSEPDFSAAVRSHLTTLRTFELDPDEIKKLPTEEGWAYQVGQHCEWWK